MDYWMYLPSSCFLLIYLSVSWLMFLYKTKKGMCYQNITSSNIYEIINRNEHSVNIRNFKTNALCDDILFDDLFNYTGNNYRRLSKEELGLALLAKI